MKNNDEYHEPPFLSQILEHSVVAENGVFFDLYGGDASVGIALLQAFPNMRYWYFDIDSTAIERAQERLKRFGSRARINRLNAAYLDIVVLSEGLKLIDCALYDPGLRRGHILDPSRGFLAKKDGPLDGRYDKDQDLTIEKVVNEASVEELKGIFQMVELPFPERIANAIVEARKSVRISTTAELAKIVDRAFPYKARRKNVLPEVIVMLALRIYVNDELHVLDLAVRKGFDALNIGGRLLTISYHSGEARIFKRFARDFDERYADDENKKLRVLTKKTIKPSDDEIRMNPLIRSAQYRAYEKIK